MREVLKKSSNFITVIAGAATRAVVINASSQDLTLPPRCWYFRGYVLGCFFGQDVVIPVSRYLHITVVVLYVLTMVGVGYWSMRRTRNIGDFFLGGRSLGPW